MPTEIQIRVEQGEPTISVLLDGAEYEIETDAYEGDTYIAPVELVRLLPLSALTRALTHGDRRYALTLSRLSINQFDNDYADRWATLNRDRPGWMTMSFTVFVDLATYPGDDPTIVSDLARLLTPSVRPKGGDLRKVEFDEVQSYVEPPWPFIVELGIPVRGRTVDDALQLVSMCEHLVEATKSSSLTLDAIVALLRAGQGDALIGHHENIILEVKRAHYDLGEAPGQIELAQDVARFANAERGGALVIGMRGKKIAGGERITSATGLVADRADVLRYRQCIERRVFPLVDGMDVFTSSSRSGDLLVIVVPPQQEELKPFLVHGTVVAGRREETFISIVRRRDEHSVPIGAAAIHAMLVAGRALLRRGQLPSD